jgi:hypothetical protein
MGSMALANAAPPVGDKKPKYRLYVDESGDHTFRPISGAEWRKRYLCLFGCAFEIQSYERNFCEALRTFKAKHFGEDPDERVILHREDIVHKRPPFDCLIDTDKSKAFDADLIEIIKKTSFIAFAVVIDKYAASGRNFASLPFDPYYVALLAMMERYCGLLQFRRSLGDVLAESRGGNEDRQLKAAFRTVYNAGTHYHNPQFFQQVLSSKELKIKPKSHNIAGLQLADVLAHPSKQQILADRKFAPAPFGFAASLSKLVENKYNRRYANDQVEGYGRIFIGQK